MLCPPPRHTRRKGTSTAWSAAPGAIAPTARATAGQGVGCGGRCRGADPADGLRMPNPQRRAARSHRPAASAAPLPGWTRRREAGKDRTESGPGNDSCSGLQQPAEEQLRAAAPGKQRCPMRASRRETGGQMRLSQHGLDRLRDGRCLCRIHQQTGLSGDLRHRGDAGGDGRRTRGHRFHHR